MRKALLPALVLMALCGVPRSIINPNFTPAHLVAQATEIQAAALARTDDPTRWTLTGVRTLNPDYSPTAGG